LASRRPVRSLRRPAAVDDQACASDEGGLVRSEVAGRAADLARMRDSLHHLLGAESGSSARSAFGRGALASAAAPKSVHVLSWPVVSKWVLAVMARAYS